MRDLIETTGRFFTPHAARYMGQLCKHFGHKVPAEVDGNRARITFQMGVAELLADEATLTARLSATDAEALARLRGVIDDHLKRFAFREGFEAMDWGQPAT